MDCGSWFKFGHGWDQLTFKDTTEPCAVCMESTGREVSFPTNCGHSFCIKCSRDLLFYDANRYSVCPVRFGCPPCMHKDIKGTSCRNRPCCEEDEVVFDSWAQRCPAQHYIWNEIEAAHEID